MASTPGQYFLPPLSSVAVETAARENKRQRLEIPIFGAKYAELAVSLGAGRLELNADGSYAAGGMTPSLDELRSLRAAIDYTAPVRIMIRPRGPPTQPQGPDFIYSTLESDAMRHAILKFKQSGLLRADLGDGFVFGALRRTGQAEDSTDSKVEVDIELNTELVNLAKPFKAIFHRAFDDVLGGGSALMDMQKVEARRKAFEIVRSCGFDGILTSGGPGNAPDDAERLGGILSLASRGGEESEGKRVEVIVGGGVRSGNISGLIESLVVGEEGADDSGGNNDVWFHSSCLSMRDGTLVFDGDEVGGLVEVLARSGM